MNQQKIGYFTLVQWAAKFLFGVSPRYYLGYITTMVLQVIIEVTQLWVAALVIGQISTFFSRESNTSYILLLAGISIILMTLDKIAWSLLSLFERQLYILGSGDIYRKFNRQLASLSISQHNNPDVRKLIDRLEYEGYAWKPLNFSFELLYTSHAALRFITSSGIIVTQLPIVVLLLIVGVVPVIFIQRKSSSVGWGIWGDVGDNSRIFWSVSNNLKHKNDIEEIVPQQSATYLLDRADTAIHTYTKKASRVRKQYSLYEIVAGIFEMAMAGASYVWLIARTIGGAITFNNFVFMSSLIWQTLSSIRLVLLSIARSFEVAPFMEDFIRFTRLENDLVMIENPKIIGNEPLSIAFDNVSFRYPRQKRYSLRHVSFTLKAGEHIALVGLNGAGKTTLIRLLLRFYDPTEGQILVNGTDLRELNLDSYYKHIGTLFQSFNRYPLEFKNNITLSTKPDAKRYQQALDISGAKSVLQTIDSEETFLQPEFTDGTELSGGQWQRVAMARNIYAASDLYILDEPTSAIDALSEQQIFDKLYKELAGKSLITVSHRFNTVRRADDIVVLENGTIVEQGTHAALMKQKGLYYDMFTAQAEGYSE